MNISYYWEIAFFHRRIHIYWRYPWQSIKNICWALYPFVWVVEQDDHFSGRQWDYFPTKEDAKKYFDEIVRKAEENEERIRKIKI